MHQSGLLDGAYRAFSELPSALAVLERRRRAGTLQYGKCAPHEVEFVRRIKEKLAQDALTPAEYASFMGYEAYLEVAQLAIYWLSWSGCGSTHPGAANLIPPPTEPQLFFDCIVAALDLMGAPRAREDVCFSFEALLLQKVRDILATLHGMSRRHHDALSAALRRLQASGAIERREMESALVKAERFDAEALEQARADGEAQGLRSCAHCGAAEVHVAQFKRCGACKDKAVVFCGKECQTANWPSHKAACKAARKAAAGAAAGA